MSRVPRERGAREPTGDRWPRRGGVSTRQDGAVVFAAVAVAASLASPLAARGDTPKPGAPPISTWVTPSVKQTVLDLRHILELTERNHPNIAASRARVLQARAQLDEAKFAPFSQFSMTGGVALAPTIKGNNDARASTAPMNRPPEAADVNGMETS